MDTPDPRARITRVQARNFRSVADLDLELGDLTVLVGRNGSGKSNTVDVLRFLRDCVARGFEQALLDRGGLDTVCHRGSTALSVGVQIEYEGWTCQYQLREGADDRQEVARAMGGGEPEGVVVSSDGAVTGWDWTESNRPLLSRLASLGPTEPEGRLPYISPSHHALFEVAERALLRVRDYDFPIHELKGPQRARMTWPLDERGMNLYAVLSDILRGPDGETVRQVLRLAVDGAGGIEVDELGNHFLAQVLYPSGGDGDTARSGIDLESDGTIRLVATLAALYQSPSLPFIILEEPERNVHPGVAAVLAGVLEQASARGQVLVTTHSPDLIDGLDVDSLRVVERVDGGTVVGRVDAIQRGIIRDKLFSTGELMRVQGLNREES
ncbi:AAA family ATPase [Rubrivirga sp.]|uniref:AAA family ATPase n=1 Tax=Rubrivirga sp. TaxID=1885344 RepID=UPI003B51F37D